MEKIASPQDLSSELQRLLKYAEGPNPSREKLATDLRTLADRVSHQVQGVYPSLDDLGPLLDTFMDAIVKGVRDIVQPDVEPVMKLIFYFQRNMGRYGLEGYTLRDPKAMAEDILYATDINVKIRPDKLQRAIKPYIVKNR